MDNEFETRDSVSRVPLMGTFDTAAVEVVRQDIGEASP